MLPGYGEQMRAISLKYVPTAVLSRQTAGGSTYIEIEEGEREPAARCTGQEAHVCSTTDCVLRGAGVGKVDMETIMDGCRA
jgi:molybdopterin biosynthesis enzyme MoaB